jgi:flagellar assembly factor FliW
MTAIAVAAPPCEERVATTRFGTVAYREEAVLDFPKGLPGFAANRRFLFARVPRVSGPFHLLHGLDGDAVDLLVAPLDGLDAGVAAADVDAARRALAIPTGDLLVLCVVTLPARGSGGAPRVNLRAPILVDVARRTAAQVVLANPGYPFREPLRAA